MSLADTLRAAPGQPCHPVTRHMLVLPEWAAMATALATDPDLALLGLWADPTQVYALFREPDGTLLPVSVGVEDGFYPALSPSMPEAAPFERLIRDLWGHGAAGTTDPRALIDHGRWPVTTPLANRHGAAAEPTEIELAPPPPGADRMLRQGPVPGGLRPAGELVLAIGGSRILAAERRAGQAHRGVLALLRGKSPRAAARFAARLAGDATVAHGIAFARAAEAACGLDAPPRAVALRALMAALERITIALADFARLAQAGGAGLLAATLAARQDRVMQAAAAAFGHRLMMDCTIPGGVALDVAPPGAAAIAGLATLAADLAETAAATLAPRLRHLPAALDAMQRHLAAIATCDTLSALLDTLPDGPIATSLPIVSGEAIGQADGPHGPIWHWLRLEGGQIGGAFLCDPGWTTWPAYLAALAGADAEDTELLLAAFACSAAGTDL